MPCCCPKKEQVTSIFSGNWLHWGTCLGCCGEHCVALQIKRDVHTKVGNLRCLLSVQYFAWLSQVCVEVEECSVREMHKAEALLQLCPESCACPGGKPRTQCSEISGY